MMYDTTTARVLAEARAVALASSSYHDTSPVDPDVALREDIAALAGHAPSAGTAGSLLNIAATQPVPLDPESMEPTAKPLTDLAAVRDHYRSHPLDGAGVRAGVQSNGGTVFAVHGTLAALRAWLAEFGAETHQIISEYGNVLSAKRSYSAVTPYVQVSWTPPPSSGARTITASGAGLLTAHEQLRTGRGENERALGSTAWLVWTVAPEQRRLVVRSRKLGKGVDVVGSPGVIPWYLRRGDGWTCSASGMPIAGDVPISPWLAAAVGATWVSSKEGKR